MSEQELQALASLLLTLAMFPSGPVEERFRTWTFHPFLSFSYFPSPFHTSQLSLAYFLLTCIMWQTWYKQLWRNSKYELLIKIWERNLMTRRIALSLGQTDLLVSPLATHQIVLFWQPLVSVDSLRCTLPAIHTFLPLSFYFSSKSVS